jgi:hypothetical protein
MEFDATYLKENAVRKSIQEFIAKRLLFLAPQVAELKEKHSLMRKHSAGVREYLRTSAVNENSVCVRVCPW